MGWSPTRIAALTLALAAGAGASGAAWLGAPWTPASEAGPADLLKVGDEVPDLKLRMADGTDAKLSSHEGKVILLFFYGTWGRRSPAYARRMDDLRKARAKQKLAVVGVARDGTREEAKKFGEEHSIGFAQAADPKDETYSRFAEKGLPWVAIVDAREGGKRKLRHTAGGFDEETLSTALADLLGKTDAEREKEEREKAEREKAEKSSQADKTEGAAEPARK